MSQAAATPVLTGRSGSDSRSFPARFWKSFRRFCTQKKVGAFGLAITLFIVVIAVIGPAIVPYDKDQTFDRPNPKFDINSFDREALSPTTLDRLSGPSADHWLGTDDKGRDMLTRIILGARLSLQVGIAASALATILGATIGIVSGYVGGLFDLLVQRLVDAAIAIPGTLFLLLLLQTSQPSKTTTISALTVLGIFGASRLVRSAVLAIRNDVYIQAARSVGASAPRIMVRHVLPNVAAPLLVVFTIQIGGNILAESGLAFLGLGVPGPSWGQMVATSRTFVDSKPLMSIFAGGAITLTVLGLNLLGDALRDWFDPRQRGAK
ncbi:MAG: ABC transporter permease [Dehalococcoidia bacterium]